MYYEKPEIEILRFSTGSFLNNEIDFSAADGDGGIDDTNLGDIGHEIINNIFTP